MRIVHDGGRSRRLIRSALPAALALALAQTIATIAFAQQPDRPPGPPDDPRTSCPDGDNPDAPCPQPAAGVQDLQTVEVRGVRGSIASAIALKQQATEITDSIVAEDIGKLPDNSVAATLQRVAGVQVTRGAGEVGTVLVRAISFSETGAQPSAIYVAPVESLDFPLNYDVNPRMTLSLEATNLLGKLTRNYFGDEYLYPRDVGSLERTASFGLRFLL